MKGKNDLFNSFKNYCDLFNNYKDYLEMIYKNLNYNYIKHRRYLINLKELEKLKNDIEYNFYEDNNVNKYEKHIKYKIDKLYEENKSIEFKGFEQVKIESSIELLNLINNNNEYIFIDIYTWKNLCKKGKEKEKYYPFFINSLELIFSSNDNKCVRFKHNKNIINKNSYISTVSNEILLFQREELINIIQLVNYYNFINKKINEKIPFKLDSFDYCLVNSKWMEYLKNFYNFELINHEFNLNNEINHLIAKNNKAYKFHLIKLEDIKEIITKISKNVLEKINLNN